MSATKKGAIARGRPAYAPLSASQVRREIAALRDLSNNVGFPPHVRADAAMAMHALEWARGAPWPVNGKRRLPTSKILVRAYVEARGNRTERTRRDARRL